MERSITRETHPYIVYSSDDAEVSGVFRDLQIYVNNVFKLSDGYLQSSYVSRNSLSKEPIKVTIIGPNVRLNDCIIDKVSINKHGSVIIPCAYMEGLASSLSDI